MRTTRTVILLAATTLAVCGSHVCAAQPDPATQIVNSQLSADDIAACRKLFLQLASENFDAREQALTSLVAKGPAVLSLAQEYAKSHDNELSAQAKGLEHKILLNFDGYLPASAALKTALRQPVTLEGTAVDLRTLARKASAKLGVRVEVDPAIADTETLEPANVAVPLPLMPESFGCVGVLRGDVYFITTPQTAQRISVQRHRFDWSELALGRDEAERVGKVFCGFLPPTSTELHTAPETLLVRGEEDALARVARLIALLKPGAPDAIWPATSLIEPERIAALAEQLSEPVTIGLAGEEPVNVVGQLAQANRNVVLVSTDAPEGPPVAKLARAQAVGAAPLSLSLRMMPLGLALRWVERRAKFPAANQTDLRLGFETSSTGRLQLRVQPRTSSPLSYAIGGADVTFLYPRGAQLGPDSDAAAAKGFCAAMESHLASFPAIDCARDIAVLRGRLFVQGPCATVAQVLAIVRLWREHGAPAPAKWKTDLETLLQRKVAWDGRGQRPARLLAQLRQIGGVNLLLEDAPDGSAPAFELTAKDAELLPPGEYPFKSLLDELGRIAHAQWKIELGAVVIMPKIPERK
ncbi:MAG TPA: hypothetical protein VGP72_17555 [Planctomycetota bacterium]|jgi:hypothetical protein